MCSVTKEAYAIVLVTDTFKKQTRHIITGNSTRWISKVCRINMLRDEKIINKLYAEYNDIMH